MFRNILLHALFFRSFLVTILPAIAGIVLAASSAWADSPGFLKVVTSSPQHAGLSFSVNVTALAEDGTPMPAFNGLLTLSALDADGAVPLLGGESLTITNGSWNGLVTVPTNGVALTLHGEASGGLSGNSSEINVLPLKLVQVPLLVEDMVYDPSRQRVFATVSSSVPIYSNSVVRIDPESGTIEAAVAVGPITPAPTLVYYTEGKIALSDNGQFLYVAYSNATFVRRIEAATMTPGPSFAIGSDIVGNTLGVADMKVLPGQPLTIAIVRARPDIRSGMAVYDNGVKRPVETPFGTSYYVVAPSATPTVVYALGNPGFARLAVDTNGISLMDGMAFPGAASKIRLEFEGGLCFTASGAVIDPLVPVMLGSFSPQLYAPLVAPDTERQRVSFISNLGGSYVLQPHALEGFLPLKALLLPKSYDWARCFIRCGTNIYAYGTSEGQLVFVQSPLLTPSGPPADLVVSQSSAPQPTMVGSDLTLSITVSNAGPALATDVTITDLLDATVNVVSAEASQGSETSVAGAQLLCNLGNIEVGSNATYTVTVRPTLGGWLTNYVTVLANETDATMTNNVSLLSSFSRIASAPDSIAIVRLATRDIAYAATTSRLYATVPGSGIVISNALVPIDPLTGQFDPVVLSTNDPGRLAISDDAQMLYVGAGADQTIWRVELPAGVATLSFPVGVHPDPSNPVPYGVDDMEVLPGQSHALAISRRRAATATWSSANVGIAIYDDGVSRPVTTSPVPDFDVIEFGSSPNDLFDYYRPAFRRLKVDANGVTVRDSITTLMSGQAEDFRCEADLIFTTGGSLIDPKTRTKLGAVGSLQTSSLVEPDPASGRVFYLVPTASPSQWVLRAYDLHTLAPLGSMTVSNIVGTPARLIRWGSDGVAFRTSGDRLFLLRTSLLPASPPADLAVTCQWNPSPATVGSNFVFTITATNCGLVTASNVVTSVLLPDSFTILTVTSGQGACGRSNLTAFCRASSLPAGGTLVFNVLARPSKVGVFRVFAGVLSDGVDLQTSNNVVEASVPVHAAGKLNQADELALTTQDMVYDRADGNLLASVAAGASAFPGSILAIDPATGEISPLQQLTNNPARLAVTDTGSHLYVGTADSNSVVRLDLQSHEVAPLLSLGTNSGQMVALQDMETLPASSNSIALSWAAGAKRSVVVYDGKVARTNCPIDVLGARFLAFGASADSLYANANNGRLRALNVISNGVVEEWGINSLLGSSEDLEFDSGLLYTSGGKVINPVSHLLEASLTGLGTDALLKTRVSAGRVFYLTKSGSLWSLQAYDSHTLGLIGSLSVSNVSGAPSRLLQWGTNGFAFRTSSNQVFLVRTDLLPFLPPADIALAGSAQPVPATVGSNLTYTINVTNSGPNNATNVVFTDRLSPDVTFVSASSTRGTCTLSNKIVRCPIGPLAIGELASVTITVVPQVAGQIQNLAGVVSSAADPNLTNNLLSLDITTFLQLPPNSIGTVRLDAAGLVYDAATKRLYASVSSALSPWRDSIVEIDPRNGSIQKILSANQPSRMALSDDSEFLYVAVEGGVGVQRFHLPTRSSDLMFYVRDPAAPLNIFIRDLAVAPGAPSQLAVAVGPLNTSASDLGVSLYHDGIAATNTGHGSEIEFVSAATLFGYEHNLVPSQTYRMNVQSNGLTITDTVGYLVAGHMKFDSGYLYTASGQKIDPVSMSVVGTFATGGTLIESTIAEQRVYFLALTNGNSAWALRACDTATFQLTGDRVLTNIQGVPDDLVRCGYDMLAFRTATNQVCLLRTGFVPALTDADSDGDGQPDAWEAMYGLDILSSADALRDSDGDGMANLHEYFAGTNPTNAASVFRLNYVSDASGMELSFMTVTGRNYRLERNHGLTPGGWQVEVFDFPGTGSNMAFTTPFTNFPTNVFYRAVVKP